MRTKPQPRPNVRELLALNLKRLRAVRGWSQDVLALEAELDRTFVAHVERMKRNISLDNIEKLAAALDVPTALLLLTNQSPRLLAPKRAKQAKRRRPLAKIVKAARPRLGRKSRTART